MSIAAGAAFAALVSTIAAVRSGRAPASAVVAFPIDDETRTAA